MMTEALFPLFRTVELQNAVTRLAQSTDDGERGAVYTRPEIVRAILDLAGYVPDEPLYLRRLLEPSFGGGDFLLPALERLLESFGRAGKRPADAMELRGALSGVEVHEEAFNSTRDALLLRLQSWGASFADARILVAAWLRQDDFLLTAVEGEFDYVVGNPPYVRQERIPDALLTEYRHRYKTIYDRADLYVPFYERGLTLLRDGGRLAFICANRWLKNKYGGPLREYASAGFHLQYFIDLEGSPAFQSDVIAYPAITVFRRGSTGDTRIARRPEVSDASLRRLVAAMLNGGPASDSRIDQVARAVGGGDPWLLDAPDRLRLLRRLEDQFVPLEQAGCKVGIGVATGADKVYIGRLDELPVEDERKLPLLTGRDLVGLDIRWRGLGVVNPFNDDGSLASLDAWPKFGAYMRLHEAQISSRHCAQKSDTGWYRTIDRIWRELTFRPKLVIPDIKGEPTVVLDAGAYYPHHNLYFVVSDDWELPALATVLRSSLAVLFISSYCVRMAGGFLRFQAQYLRRVHVPLWPALDTSQRAALREASQSRDIGVIDAAVAKAYGLSPAESTLVRLVADEARVKRKQLDGATSTH